MVNLKNLKTKVLSVIKITEEVNPSTFSNSNDERKWKTIRFGEKKSRFGKPVEVLHFQINPGEIGVAENFREGQRVIILVSENLSYQYAIYDFETGNCILDNEM